jgi:hypothetical protein
MMFKVVGRRLTLRLVAAGWLEQQRMNGGVYFESRNVHAALARLQREGYLLEPRFRALKSERHQGDHEKVVIEFDLDEIV